MHLKQYRILTERCTNCYQCLVVCPAAAIELSAAGMPEIQNSKCRRCGRCKRICKQKAIAFRVKLQF